MRKAVRVLILIITLSILSVGAACSELDSCAEWLNSLTSGYSVYFLNSDVTLEMGEKKVVSIDDLKFEDLPESRARANVNFKLSSSNSAVVKAVGKTIVAQSPGKTTVTLTTDDGMKAYLNVAVKVTVESVDLEFPFGRFLPYGSKHAIDVYAVVNDGALPASNYRIIWTINGRAVNFTGNPLTLYESLMPEIYEIKATLYDGVKKFEKTVVAGYYNAALVFSGMTINANNSKIKVGESVKFLLSDEFNYAEWYMQDVFVGEGASLEIAPDKPGYYTVYAMCAGEKTNAITITVTGEVSPADIKADYDDDYPLLTVKWTGMDKIECRVIATPTDGGEEVVAISDSGSATLSVDPEKSYDVMVKATGKDGYSAPAGEQEKVRVSAITQIEKHYLEKKYYGGNYYITDDEEFFDLFDYMMYFRPQPVTSESTSSIEQVYLAYDYGDYDDLLGRAFDYAGVTGSYTIGGSAHGNRATISLEFFTVNTPVTTSEYNQSYHNDSLVAFPVSWQAQGDRVDYFSAAKKGKVIVTTTDQMFRVAEKGYIPVPKTGTTAAKAYEYAKNVLDSIINDSMDDMQRALAIYEYIMTKNTYDSSVLSYSIEKAVVHAAFYMESILNDGSSYGVCDAMSKTYSFLCNMANVKAIRIVGYAGTGEEKGGHAWNKVCIDGKWYIVDCTWGDAGLTLRKKSGNNYDSVTCESASHAYFLLTDAEVFSTHVPESDLAPRTCVMPYKYYAYTNLGEKYDYMPLYVQEQGTKLLFALEDIASYIVGKWKGEWQASATGIDIKSSRFGLEFAVCERSLDEVKSILSGRIRGTFYSKLENAGLKYNIFCDENVFYIIVVSNDELYNTKPSEGSKPTRPWWFSFL